MSPTTTVPRTSSPTTAVPLPRRTPSSPPTPIWPIHSPAKCARNERDGGICCKELKDADERTLIDPDIVRDVCVSLSHSFF
jgi:vacuolar iron transporter family protein